MAHDAWKTVVDLAKDSGVDLSIEDQRIIVATMVCIVFDFMCTEVKEFKKNDSEENEQAASLVVEGRANFESTVMLKRYAGAALYSMIEK